MVASGRSVRRYGRRWCRIFGHSRYGVRESSWAGQAARRPFRSARNKTTRRLRSPRSHARGKAMGRLGPPSQRSRRSPPHAELVRRLLEPIVFRIRRPHFRPSRLLPCGSVTGASTVADRGIRQPAQSNRSLPAAGCPQPWRPFRPVRSRSEAEPRPLAVAGGTERVWASGRTRKVRTMSRVAMRRVDGVALVVRRRCSRDRRRPPAACGRGWNVKFRAVLRRPSCCLRSL